MDRVSLLTTVHGRKSRTQLEATELKRANLCFPNLSEHKPFLNALSKIYYIMAELLFMAQVLENAGVSHWSRFLITMNGYLEAVMM